MSEQVFHQAVRLARQGDAAGARALLQELIAREPHNFQAWSWLAYVVPTDVEKRAALRRALALQPDNVALRETLRRLISPTHIQRAAQAGVFIGYARADELFTVDLNDHLRAGGIKTWLDMTEISVDSTWHSSIMSALRQCGLLLVVLSPEGLRDDEMAAQRQWFLQTGKIIVPVLHKTCDYESLDLLCPPVDFRAGFETGIRSLLHLLRQPHEAGQLA
jgi:hypothetical protein